MILKLVDVSYLYDKRKENQFALKDVNCQFERGKVYAIVGHSGSGKTTLLSLLAGLDLPTKGDVLFYDQQKSGESTRELDRLSYRRQSVSIVFQDFQLFPLLTAVENVAFPLVTAGENEKLANEKATALLASVGIASECYHRFPAKLSGGEQQRVAIARALSTNPQILLADEPTGNLDGENADNVMAQLVSLAHEQNLCVVIVTHDGKIAEACDIIYQMSGGHLTVQCPEQ